MTSTPDKCWHSPPCGYPHPVGPEADRGTVTVELRVLITVPLDAWALTYGMEPEDVAGDVAVYFDNEEVIPGGLRVGLPVLDEVGAVVSVRSC